MQQAADRAADDVEEKVTQVSQRILDRAAEDPEINEVAEEVDEAAVQEERGHERDQHFPPRVLPRRRMNEPRRDVAERLDHQLRPRPERELHDEDGDVREDERPVDDRCRAARKRVSERDHGSAAVISFTISSNCASVSSG